MSTTSKIPKHWADKPWHILSTPQSQGYDINDHYSVYMATAMCHVHNIFIRAMNSICLQSPFVKHELDIADLLFYTRILVITINAHHDGEEKYMFPDLVKYTEDSSIMAVNQAQHAAFHSGLKRLEQYCINTTPAQYSQSDFQSMIDSFAQALFAHLNDEIRTILALRKYPSKGLKPIWAKGEKHIMDVGSFDEMFPLAFGCIDKGFEAGTLKFPPVPKAMNFVVNYWFARKHRGAWRFNPCDMWGVPRPLHFLPVE